MVIEKNRMNKSVSLNEGPGSPGKSENFKMRRFRDVQSKITTNNIKVGAKRQSYLASPDAQDGEDFVTTNPVSEPIKKPEMTPQATGEEGLKQE